MKKNYFSYFILFFLTLTLFIFLTPKLSIKILSFLKEKRLKQFEDYLKNTAEFNPQIFWRFREFFCPGYFKIDKSGIKIDDNELKLLDFLDKLKNNLFFAKYQCNYLKSYEGLTKENKLESFFKDDFKKKFIIIKEAKNFIYFKDKKNQLIYLVFLLPSQKMKKAVGFFDYDEKDKKLVDDKNWINITIINEKSF